jgi:hypothetical protein
MGIVCTRIHECCTFNIWLFKGICVSCQEKKIRISRGVIVSYIVSHWLQTQQVRN